MKRQNKWNRKEIDNSVRVPYKVQKDKKTKRQKDKKTKRQKDKINGMEKKSDN